MTSSTSIGRDGFVAGFQQGFRAVAKGVNGRLVARVQEQDAGGDQLVVAEFIARFIGRDQRGDQVVCGRFAFVSI